VGYRAVELARPRTSETETNIILDVKYPRCDVAAFKGANGNATELREEDRELSTAAALAAGCAGLPNTRQTNLASAITIAQQDTNREIFKKYMVRSFWSRLDVSSFKASTDELEWKMPELANFPCPALLPLSQWPFSSSLTPPWRPL